MASIERTAYPILKRNPSSYELEKLFTPSPEEIEFAKSKTNNLSAFFSMMVLFKCFQHLCYFPQKKTIPESIISHIQNKLNLSSNEDINVSNRTATRIKKSIRDYLGVKTFSIKCMSFIKISMKNTSLIRNDPIDLINVSIQELIVNSYELPAFSTLNRLAFEIRNSTHKGLFNKILRKLDKAKQNFLNKLLDTEEDYNRSPYNRLKELPKSPTLDHIEQWVDRMEWIKSLGSVDEYLADLSVNKINLFAEECRVLDASELKALDKSKCFTLILCFIYCSLHKTTDNLIEMFVKRMKIIHNSASEKLKEIRDENLGLNEKLIDVLESLLHTFENEDNVSYNETTKGIIKDNGGLKSLIEDCAKINAYKNNNYLPLLWKYYWRHRSSLFKILKLFTIRPSTEDKSLTNALDFLIQNQNKRSQYIEAGVELEFASPRWKKLVESKVKGKTKFNRRLFELCILSYVAEELRSGDLFVENSDDYSDYRQQLLSWEDCLKILDSYCSNLKFPKTPEEFVRQLINELELSANKVDKTYPENSQLEISEDGEIKLKKYKKRTSLQMLLVWQSSLKAKCQKEK